MFHRIADDIRATVPYDPLQSSVTMQVPDVSASALQSDLAASLAANPALQDLGSSTDSSSTDSSDDQLRRHRRRQSDPGVVRRCRLDPDRRQPAPRLDQIMYGVSESSDTAQLQMDQLSDLKSIKYSVPSSTAVGSSGGSGLVRLEQDRATLLYQEQNGGVDQSSLNLTPLVPEVQQVEFSYFDGQQWNDSWDSQEMGGLPWAVSITLWIVPRNAIATAAQAGQSPSQVDPSQWIQRTLVVYLPAARADLVQGADVSSDDSSTSGSTTSGTSTATGASGS